MESGLEMSRQATLFPLWPLPHRQHRSTARRVALPRSIPKVLHPYNLKGAPSQRNMVQMKEQSKTSERELSEEEIANLSDGEFKALIIKMLIELTELGQNMKEQMKDTQKEIKQNIQGTKSDRKETRTQTNNLEQKEEINIQLEQNEETRIQKNEERLRNLWENLKCSNIQIIGVPDGEQQQEIENLIEQIMKENFPNLVKEIDFQ